MKGNGHISDEDLERELRRRATAHRPDVGRLKGRISRATWESGTERAPRWRLLPRLIAVSSVAVALAGAIFVAVPPPYSNRAPGGERSPSSELPTSTRSPAGRETMPPATADASPTPSTGMRVEPYPVERLDEVGWYGMGIDQEGMTVEGPRGPLGDIHVRVTTGTLAGRETFNREWRLSAPINPEPAAWPFASGPSAGAAVIGFSDKHGSTVRSIDLTSGEDRVLLRHDEFVHHAVMDASGQYLYYALVGRVSRRDRGVWRLDLATGASDLVYERDASWDADQGWRRGVYVTPDGTHLLVVDCQGPDCHGHVLAIAGDAPPLDLDTDALASVRGLSNTLAITGESVIELASGAERRFPFADCVEDTVLSPPLEDPLLVYALGDRLSDACPAPPDRYEVAVFDPSTGAGGPLWSPPWTPANLLVQDVTRSIDLPPRTFAVARATGNVDPLRSAVLLEIVDGAHP